jgi:hypothetical protein
MTMHNVNSYTDFEKDIRIAFSNILEKYSFKMIKQEYNYILDNQKCLLEIRYDRGEVVCKVKPPEMESKGYHVLNLNRYFSKSVEEKKTWDSPLNQLKYYANILENNLQFILNGDFTWQKEYLEEETKLNNSIRFVLNNLDADHIIYKKFASGDSSWISDLKNYTEKNGIEI